VSKANICLVIVQFISYQFSGNLSNGIHCTVYDKVTHPSLETIVSLTTSLKLNTHFVYLILRSEGKEIYVYLKKVLEKFLCESFQYRKTVSDLELRISLRSVSI